MDSTKLGYAAIVGFKMFYYCRRSVGKDTITYRCKAICQCGAVRAGWIDPESLEIADAALPGDLLRTEHRARDPYRMAEAQRSLAPPALHAELLLRHVPDLLWVVHGK